MKTIEQGYHPEFYRNDARYKIFRDGENYFVEIKIYAPNQLNDGDWKEIFDIIGVELIEWLDHDTLAQVALHFPESAYGNHQN